jgi:hypothetical protein
MRMKWTNSLSSGLSLTCTFIFRGCGAKYKLSSLQSILIYPVKGRFLNNSSGYSSHRIVQPKVHTTVKGGLNIKPDFWP